MTDVHFADVPRHVGGPPRHFETLLDAPFVDLVHIVHPDRHPCPLVGGVVVVGAERFSEVAAAAAALRSLAQEDFERTRADTAEVRRVAPRPGLLPPELLEPREALLDVGDVQNWRNTFGVHDCKSEGSSGSKSSEGLV